MIFSVFLTFYVIYVTTFFLIDVVNLKEADEQQFLFFCFVRSNLLCDEVVMLAFSENAPPSF
jgi:hypothetical protein